jgi:hypothetical protein
MQVRINSDTLGSQYRYSSDNKSPLPWLFTISTKIYLYILNNTYNKAYL